MLSRNTIMFIGLVITVCIIVGLIIYFHNKSSCTPNCLNKKCGDDGCGGSCGSCEKGKKCDNGICIDNTCNPSCKNKNCGDDGCGGSCGNCIDGENCVKGKCVCNPSCKNKSCGDDGCGGSCGICTDPEYCSNGMCIKTSSSCVPNCRDKECGNNGCGGQCGTCGDGKICINGKCVIRDFEPCNGSCNNKQCGESLCDECNICSSCGTCDTGKYCLNGTCTQSNCKSSEIDVQNINFPKCCNTADNNYFISNGVDSCCPKKYNCANGCSPPGWYDDDDSNMFCNIASQNISPSWPKNPRLCGPYGEVYYPKCPITKMWAQSREGLSCEQIIANNGSMITFIESNGFKWNPEHSRCEPVDVSDKITSGVYPQLLDCLKENNNHNGICTDAISNCDYCNGNMYMSCFCGPIIKAPLYYDGQATGETLNLPVITNQVKNDILSPFQSPQPSKTSDTITNLQYIYLQIPIGLWLNLNNTYSNKGIKDIQNNFQGIGTNVSGYPCFTFDFTITDDIDCKLDIGYYKNVNINNMTLIKTEFSLIIKLVNGIINIYLNDTIAQPIISIGMQQYELGYFRSPDYTKLNTSYRLSESGNKLGLEMILALPNKNFSSSLNNYKLIKPATIINRIKDQNKTDKNKKVKSVRNEDLKGMFYTNDMYETQMLLDPANYPAII